MECAAIFGCDMPIRCQKLKTCRLLALREEEAVNAAISTGMPQDHELFPLMVEHKRWWLRFITFRDTDATRIGAAMKEDGG